MLFECNAFDLPTEDGNHATYIVACVGRVRELLFNWYRSEHDAGREHTRVQDLTPEMVGESRAHVLGTWGGAETNGLVFPTCCWGATQANWILRWLVTSDEGLTRSCASTTRSRITRRGMCRRMLRMSFRML